MVDLTPQYKIRHLIIDVNSDTFPKAGEYFVRVKKGRKPGMVYQICSYRKVNSRKFQNRYSFEVLSLPKLIKEARITGFRFNAFVKDTPAHAVIMYSKKHKPK